MLGQLLAIIRNTFFESIRQPIMLVLLVVATIGLIFSNLLAGFTMEDDQRMMIDLGLSTVLVCGSLLAAFIATNVLNREIENRTALTVIAKPVGRPIFVLGKFLGVALALLLATFYMCLVLALVEMHGVQQTVRDPAHWPVLTFGSGAVILGAGAAVWANYFYGRVFASSVVLITTPLVLLAYLFAMMFSHDFSQQPMAEGFHGQLWIAMAALTMGVMVLTSIAIAASTRLGQVMTLCTTMLVCFLGMLSNWLFGRGIAHIEALWLDRARLEDLAHVVQQVNEVRLVTGEVETRTVEKLVGPEPLSQMAHGWERLEHALYSIGYAILPNFQQFWLSDALTQGHAIPISLLAQIVLYGCVYIIAMLGVAVMLFQTREVG